jgi:hypothetical protein
MIVNKMVTAPTWPSETVTLPKNSCALVTVPMRMRLTGLIATGLWTRDRGRVGRRHAPRRSQASERFDITMIQRSDRTNLSSVK